MAATIAPTKQILMSDMFSSENSVGLRRLKTLTLTQSEFFIARGVSYVGISTRIGVDISLADDIYYSVLEVGDNYVVIDTVTQEIDFSNVSDGKFTNTLVGYVGASDGNTFSYTPNAPVPVGRSLNAEYINQRPLSTLDVGVVANVTGDEDYPLFYSAFFIDTSGNRNSLTQSGGDFFQGGRQLLAPPNSTVLIESKSIGGASGSATIVTQFFITEVDPLLLTSSG